MIKNKVTVFLIFLVVLFSVGTIGCAPKKNDIEQGIISKELKESTSETSTESATVAQENQNSEKGNGVSAHGAIKALNGKIVDQNGTPFVLKGMSTHGIVWFPQYTKYHSIQMTKNNGANVFRVAMYTEEYGGYTTGENEKQNSKSIMYSAVDNAIRLDMYAIIDWHILSDQNPQKHKAEAIQFFDEVSKKYSGNPAVIYEICNEPHDVSWKNDIKPYAEKVIPVIRKNDPDALIIVGSNTWSQDVDEASEDLLQFDNIAYSFHFYAGTHKLDNFKPKLEKALANGATIFVTEWGTSDASGNNGNYFDEANKWLDYLDSKGISRINWSLCDKNESSAILKSGADPENWNENDLTETGKFIFQSFKR